MARVRESQLRGMASLVGSRVKQRRLETGLRFPRVGLFYQATMRRAVIRRSYRHLAARCPSVGSRPLGERKPATREQTT